MAQNVVDRAKKPTPSFLEALLKHCDEHLEHSEPRVRSLVAGTLGALTRAGYGDEQEEEDGHDASQSEAGKQGQFTGLAVYCFFRERLLGAISRNFERSEGTITDVISGADNVAIDDTSGWKSLETSLLALKVCWARRTGAIDGARLASRFAYHTAHTVQHTQYTHSKHPSAGAKLEAVAHLHDDPGSARPINIRYRSRVWALPRSAECGIALVDPRLSVGQDSLRLVS